MFLVLYPYLTKLAHQCRVSSLKLPFALKSTHRCLSFDTNNIDRVRKQLETAATIDSVLVATSALDSLTPTQVSAAFKSLDRLAYDHLSTFPWAMHDNRSMLCIQSFINQEAKEFFHPIIKCPQFEALQIEAKNFSSVFSNADLASATLSLVRLHVDKSDETFVSLLQECRSRCESFDLETLSIFAEAVNFIERSGFHVHSEIARVLQDRWETIDVTTQNFVSVSRLLLSNGYFFTKDTLLYFQTKLKTMVCQLREEINPKNILEMMRSVSMYSSQTRSDLLYPCFQILEKRIDELTVYQLLRCVLLSRDSDLPFVSKFRNKVCERAFTFLNGNVNGGLRAAEVVHLLNLFEICNYPKHSRSTFEKLLEVYLDDFDVILLKSVSFCRILSHGENRILSEIFCRCVQQKRYGLIESISCLLTIVRCLATMKYRPPSFDEIMSEFLFHLVFNSSLIVQPSHLAAIGQFLVQCRNKRNERAASVYTEKLLSSLSCLSVVEMVNFARGFSFPSFKSSRLYTDYVLSRLTREILTRRNEITDLKVLNFVLSTILLKISPALRDGLTQDVIELYVSHTRHDIKQIDVNLTFSLLTKFRLRIPDVLERLTDSFVARTSEVSAGDVSLVLFTLAKLNYRPSKLGLVEEMAVEVATEVNNKKDVFNVLRIAASLAYLDIFPERLIRVVFCLSFLRNFEDAMPTESSVEGFNARKYWENLLMELNRSAVLQCPHLNVPWFCENYCEKPNHLDYGIVKKFKNIIYDGLVETLGGTEFVKTGPLRTFYGIVYDYEFVLDRNGKPVSHEGIKEENSRVAVLLSIREQYSNNDRIKTTALENKITQLEILGFRVLLIPYFDLDSMRLSDIESRKQYFKEKIFTAETNRTKLIEM